MAGYVWQAIAIYYADKRHLKPPGDAQIGAILENRREFREAHVPCSQSSVYRVRKLKHPECFPVWPVPRGALPAWLQAQERASEDLVLEDQVLELIDRRTGLRSQVDVAVDGSGHLRVTDYLTRGGTSLAAAVGGIAILDSMDGRMDGVIHWCHLLVQLAAQHTHL